jgi:hypothetical protein
LVLNFYTIFNPKSFHPEHSAIDFLNEYDFFKNFWYISGRKKQERTGWFAVLRNALFKPKTWSCLTYYFLSPSHLLSLSWRYQLLFSLQMVRNYTTFLTPGKSTTRPSHRWEGWAFLPGLS